MFLRPAVVCLLLLLPVTCALAQPGVVASWNFDEGKGDTVADGSGKGNNGTLHGATFVKRAGGYALSLDGQDDWVDCGNGEGLNLSGAVTLEAWVRPLSLPSAEPMILGKYYDSYGLTHYRDGSAWFYIGGGGHNIKGHLEIGKWSHVVATYNADEMSLYINRVRVDTRKPQVPKIPSGKSVVMGVLLADPNATDPGYGATAYWRGELDDVRVYNRALTADEVQTDYKHMAAGYGVDTTWWDKLRLEAYVFGPEQRLTAVADYEGIFPRPDDTVLRLSLRDKSGKELQSQEFKDLARQRLTCTQFPLKDLAQGEYILHGEVSAPSGLKIANQIGVQYPPQPTPLPSPAQQSVAPLPPPLNPLPFTVQVQPDGSFIVATRSRKLPFVSSFSYPQGGDNTLGPPAKPEPEWKVTTRTVGANVREIVGQGKFYSVARKLTIYPNRIAVDDTIRNTSGEDVGIIMQTHALTVGMPFSQRRVGGYDGEESEGALSPSSFVAWDDMGLGVLPLDDVSVVQGTVYAHDDRVGFGNRRFALPAGQTRTLSWAIYPQASTDYYDFINQVRKDEDRYQTVEGGFAFVPRGGLSREYAQMRNLRYASFGCLTNVADDPEIEIEGIDFLWLPKERARIHSEFENIRKDNPNLKLMFHVAHSLVSTNKPSELFPDSRVLDASGNHVVYAYPYGNGAYFSQRRHEEGWRWYIYYPRPGNSFHDALMNSVDVMVDDITCGGAFMDGFFYGYGSPWTYDRWDGMTADIDPDTRLIKRKYGSVLLMSQPSMVEYVQRMNQRGAVVIGNGTVITRTIGNLPIIVDQECVSGPMVHLAQTPCALGNATTIRNETDVYDDVLDKLKWGNLYFYYGEGTLTYASLPQQEFPITVQELHEGIITGRERIITMKSGAYGWPRDRALHICYRYNKVGIPIPAEFVTTVDRSGVRTQVALEDRESAVVKRIPVEVQSAAPVNVRVERCGANLISLTLNGQGKATLLVRSGEFVVRSGGQLMVSLNAAERSLKAGKDGILRVPVTLKGQTSVSVWQGAG